MRHQRDAELAHGLVGGDAAAVFLVLDLKPALENLLLRHGAKSVAVLDFLGCDDLCLPFRRDVAAPGKEKQKGSGALHLQPG